MIPEPGQMHQPVLHHLVLNNYHIVSYLYSLATGMLSSIHVTYRIWETNGNGFITLHLCEVASSVVNIYKTFCDKMMLDVVVQYILYVL